MPQRYSLEESLVKSNKLKKCPVDLKERNLIPTCKREEYYTDRELKKPEVIDNLQPDQRPDVIPPIYTANGIQVLTPRSFQMSNGEIQFLNAIPDDRRRVPRPPMSHEAFLIDYHTDNQQQMHTPSKLPSKIYQQHQQFLQEFRDHPETTNLDIAAAEMSQATYIDDSMLRQEFIENVSTLGRQGWELDRDARVANDYAKILATRVRRAGCLYRRRPALFHHGGVAGNHGPGSVIPICHSGGVRRHLLACTGT